MGPNGLVSPLPVFGTIPNFPTAAYNKSIGTEIFNPFDYPYQNWRPSLENIEPKKQLQVNNDQLFSI